MGKRGERKLKELYNKTKQLIKPEITPVLEGSCRIQGPVDGDDHEFRVQFKLPAKKEHKSVSQSSCTRTEAGACNVCSTPCSSCMHLKQAVSVMESSASSGSSNSMIKKKEVNSCPFIRDDQKIAESWNQQATSEVSTSSCLDSFSENAESKATLKVSSVVDTSDDAGMPLVASSAAVEGKHISENNGDSISRVTAAKDANVTEQFQYVDSDKNNVISTSKVVVGEGSQEIEQVATTPTGNDHETKDDHGRSSEMCVHPEDQKKIISGLSSGSVVFDCSKQVDVSLSALHSANDLPPHDVSDGTHLPVPVICAGTESSSSGKENDPSATIIKNAKLPCGQQYVDSVDELNPIEQLGSEGNQTKNPVSNLTSGNSSDNKLQMETGNVKNLGIPSAGALCTLLDDSSEKRQILIDASSIVSAQLHSQLKPENEDSESELEDDVKVCDICGDAGREECLAFCSRCSDGAEHTYCMRVMMDKIPEGYWLCEECMTKEESESRKSNTSDALAGMHQKDASKVCSKQSGGEDKANGKGSQSLKTSFKRQIDLEVASKGSTNGPESIGGSEVDGPNRKSILSRHSSFKNLDAGKGRPASISPSHRSQSSIRSSHAFVRSQAYSGSSAPEGPLQPPASRGAFSKSSSFSNYTMKGKVKQLVDDIPAKPKLIREVSNRDARKDSLTKAIIKSTSFKGFSSHIESTSKLQGLGSPRLDNQKDSKQGKERYSFERKNYFAGGHYISSASSVKPGSVVPAKSDLKVAQHDWIPNYMAEASNIGIDKGSEEPSDLGHKELRKQLLPVGKGLVESINHDNKDILSRQPIQSGSRLRCQKCKETGHSSQYCSMDKLCLSAFKPSAERISRDGNKGSTKWKDLIESVNSRNQTHRSKSSDKVEGVSLSTVALNVKDLPSNSSSSMRNLPALDGRPDGQTNQKQSLASVGNRRTIIESNQQAQQTPCTPRSNEFITKPYSDGLPLRGSSYWASAIPEFAFIWQGSFEILKLGGVSEVFEGLQAHLSSAASPEVHNVTTKFPSNVRLEEAPRERLWPSQLERNGPKGDNIALFFFAKDIESYERSYKKLLDNILGNDVALKGNINGVDLLIFPSSILPSNFQRWNMLFFLWGVFKENSIDASKSLPGVNKQPRVSDLDVKPLVQDDFSPCTAELSLLHRKEFWRNPDKDSSLPDKQLHTSTRSLQSDGLHNVSFDKKPTIMVSSDIPKEASSDVPMEMNHAVADKLSRALLSSTVPVKCSNDSSDLHNIYVKQSGSISPSESSEMQDTTVGNSLASEKGQHSPACSHIDSAPLSFSRSSGSAVDFVSPVGKPGARGKTGATNIVEVKMEPASGSDPMEIDQQSSDSKPGRKRSFDSMNTFLQASGELSKSSDEAILWGADCTPKDQHNHKKVKLNSDGHAKNSSSGEETLSRSSARVQPLLPSLNDPHPVGDAYDKNAMPQTSGSVERSFFPVNNGSVKNVKAEDVIDLSSDEESPYIVSPDLELGLGSKKHSVRREAVPLFRPFPDKRSKQDIQPAEDRVDVSASLSLSLGFPDMEKERKSNGVLEAHPFLPERSSHNSSFLFGGFTDT